MKKTTYNSTTLYGNEISQYGLDNGYMDLGTIMKCIPHIMCNNIASFLYEGDCELIQSGVDTSELEERLEALQERKEEIEEILSEVDDKLEGYDSVSDIEDEKDDMESALNSLQEVMDATYYHEITSFYVADSTFESVLCELYSCLESRIEGLEETIDKLENIVGVCGAYSVDEEVVGLRDELEGIEDTISDIEDEIENATPDEVFQYFLTNDYGRELIEEFLPEYPMWYNATLDLYVLGVTHLGTSWDYVLTNVKLELDEEVKTDHSRIVEINNALIELSNLVPKIENENARNDIVDVFHLAYETIADTHKYL